MYIDPNTGGLLFQILAVVLAVLSGTVVLFSSKIRMFFSRVKRYFRERSAKGEESPTENK